MATSSTDILLHLTNTDKNKEILAIDFDGTFNLDGKANPQLLAIIIWWLSTHRDLVIITARKPESVISLLQKSLEGKIPFELLTLQYWVKEIRGLIQSMQSRSQFFIDTFFERANSEIGFAKVEENELSALPVAAVLTKELVGISDMFSISEALAASQKYKNFATPISQKARETAEQYETYIKNNADKIMQLTEWSKLYSHLYFIDDDRRVIEAIRKLNIQSSVYHCVMKKNSFSAWSTDLARDIGFEQQLNRFLEQNDSSDFKQFDLLAFALFLKTQEQKLSDSQSQLIAIATQKIISELKQSPGLINGGMNRAIQEIINPDYSSKKESAVNKNRNSKLLLSLELHEVLMIDSGDGKIINDALVPLLLFLTKEGHNLVISTEYGLKQSFENLKILGFHSYTLTHCIKAYEKLGVRFSQVITPEAAHYKGEKFLEEVMLPFEEINAKLRKQLEKKFSDNHIDQFRISPDIFKKEVEAMSEYQDRQKELSLILSQYPDQRLHEKKIGDLSPDLEFQFLKLYKIYKSSLLLHIGKNSASDLKLLKDFSVKSVGVNYFWETIFSEWKLNEELLNFLKSPQTITEKNWHYALLLVSCEKSLKIEEFRQNFRHLKENLKSAVCQGKLGLSSEQKKWLYHFLKIEVSLIDRFRNLFGFSQNSSENVAPSNSLFKGMN